MLRLDTDPEGRSGRNPFLSLLLILPAHVMLTKDGAQP